MSQATAMAVISLILYLSLGCTSAYFYVKLFGGSTNEDSALRKNVDILQTKKVFFLVLTISAFLDTPLYVGCLAHHGPTECEWDSLTYSFCWIFHLLALGGYAICMGIPLFLWTNIFRGRDGSIFSSKYPDFSKVFLHLSIGCYVFVQVANICTLIFGSDARKPSTFSNNPVNAYARFLEAFLIVAIAAVWLWCGIRLQRYIVEVRFAPPAQRRILLTINAVMTMVLCSYLLRALMIFSLFLGYFHVKDFTMMQRSYMGWLICTRYLPYIFCSYLLIFLMRRSTPDVDSSLSIDSETRLSSSLLTEFESSSQGDLHRGHHTKTSSIPLPFTGTTGKGPPSNSSGSSSMTFLLDGYEQGHEQGRLMSRDNFFSSTQDAESLLLATNARPGSTAASPSPPPSSSSYSNASVSSGGRATLIQNSERISSLLV